MAADPPAGLFQPSGTWRLTVNVAQPVYDGGRRSGLKAERTANLRSRELSLEQLTLQARAEVRTATRRYAKRQLTWFRAEPGIVWLDAARPIVELAAEVERHWHDRERR